MIPAVKTRADDKSLCEDGIYELYIADPQTPNDDFLNDIYISLQQMKAGDVVDADESLRRLRNELELDTV